MFYIFLIIIKLLSQRTGKIVKSPRRQSYIWKIGHNNMLI